MPLTDRTLTQAERSVPLAADLQEAINRIEPIFDPTRMNAFQDVFELRISPGSAFMADVFGEHWHLAADDPNVHLKVRAIGLAWLRVGERSCDQFSKTRPHEIGEAVLTALSQSDCHRLMSRRSQDFDDAVPVPIASVPTSVPVFAAPLPGARMSSSDFWAAQKARIEAVRARLQRRWGTLRSPAAH